MSEICPLCGSGEQLVVYVTRDRHYGIKGEFTVVRCSSCSLVRLSPMPSEKELASYYPEDFYAYQPISATNRGMRYMLRRVFLCAIRTKDPRFAVPGTLLDLGCGSGAFLAQYRKRGWEAWGVELNTRAATYGRAVEGLNIFGGSLLEAKLPSNYFDYIRANHSLEHIPNPNDTLRELRRIIKPTGLLHIGVPNIDSVNARVFGRYWWYLGAPVHTFNYSRNTLIRLARKNGFTPIRVKYNSDYGGTVGSLQIVLNRNCARKSTEGLVINSTPIKVVGQWVAKLFDVIRQGDVIEVTFRPV